MKTAHTTGAVFRGKFVALGCLFSGWLPSRNDGVMKRDTCTPHFGYQTVETVHPKKQK